MFSQLPEARRLVPLFTPDNSFIGIMGQLKAFQLDQQMPILQEAAKAAWVIMNN
jgi:hypothetical protein